LSLGSGIPALIVLYFIGLPNDLWSPVGFINFIRAFLCVGLIFAGSLIAMSGSEMTIDSYILRHIREGEAIMLFKDQVPQKAETTASDYPNAGTFLFVVGLIACVVLVVRYVYLIIASVISLAS
jgi:ABC-type multidrug transport system fused ATPase/permease subunit